MPEDLNESEIYISHGWDENQIDIGNSIDVNDLLSIETDGKKFIREIVRGRRYKLTYTSEEQRRRMSQPPVAQVPLKPNKTVSRPPPEESVPITEDVPELQGAPDIVAAPDDVIILKTDGQDSTPLVSSREPSHEVFDQLNPILPEDVANLLSSPPADFDAFTDRLRKNRNEPKERDPTFAAPAARKPATDADPVDLFRGAFTISVVDLTIPTPFIPIAMSRSYRSGRPYFGPFGYGWDHTYYVYLRELHDGGFALWTGQLREEHFRNTGAGFEPEAGLTARLERTTGIPEAFSVQFPGGNQWIFERPTGWSDLERIPLVAIRDRHGNSVNLTYDSINRVTSVLDDSRRGLLFQYGSCDLLERVTDHTGLREIRYEHDPEIEHLVRVILPATSQYPKGLQTTYEYASYDPHPAMRHNILRIHDAEDRLIVENDFAGPESGWEFNSVVRQRIGGFEYQFGYEEIQYVEPDAANVEVLAARTLVRPPDGSLHTYTFNYRGDLLDHRFRLNSDGSFRVVSYQWQYDSEGNVIETVGPDGQRKVFTFDSSNVDPCARGNVLQMQLAAPMSGIVPSRILFEAQYDPRFQLSIRTKDESGAETQFLYDFNVSPFGSSGRLRQVERPAVTGADGLPQQSIVTFEHNARGQMTAATTPEGCRTEFRYFSAGMLDGFLSTVTQDPSGASLVSAVQYDAAGFAKTVEAPGGRTSGFVHNALGQVEELTAPLIAGQEAKLRRWFDDSGSVVRVERPAGSYVGLPPGTSIADEYERDHVGNVRRTIMAGNTTDRREWRHSVDHEGRVVATWDPLGIRMERAYGEDGALLSETAAASESVAQKIEYFHDRAGRLRRLVDARNGETKIDYDVWGRPHKITLPAGAVWTLELGVNDRMLEERLEEPVAGKMLLRQRQTYEYDRRGRLIFATRFAFRDDPTSAVPLKARYLYDKDDRLRELMLPRGARYRYAFDTCGRLSEAIDLHGNVRRFVYGMTGELSELVAIQVENGVTRTTTQVFQYDARGRLERSTFLDSLAEFRYDDRNLAIEHRAPNGVTSRLRFNAHGQMVESIVDPAGLFLQSHFEYDLNGCLNRYVDPTGKTTAWNRDALGRATSLKPPDGTEWKYFFDNALTTRQQTPAGNGVVYELTDGSGRLIKVTSLAAPGQKAVAPRELAFDGVGRLVRASAGADSVQRQYDSLGRLIEETARGNTVRMEYDDTTGSADLIYPDGRRERTENNPAGQPTRITLVTPGALGGGAGDVLLEIIYSTAGRPVRVVYGNGVEGHLVHDDRDRLIRIEYQKSGLLLDSCRLRYDENGHRAIVQYLGAPARNLVHDFDGAGRLVEARAGFPLAPLPDVTAPSAEAADVAAARVASAAAPGVAFLLDDADARTEVKRLNGGPTGETYVLGSDHRVAIAGAAPISYNLDGHRTMDSRYIYELDALNRVSRVRDRVTSAILTELQYDGLSRVSAGSTDGQVFERWFSGPTQIHEVSGAGPGVARQHSSHPLWASPFCVTDAAGSAFTHQDEGLSTMCVTDATGTVIERHRYEVFGARAAFAEDGVTPLSSLRAEPMWRGMPALGTTKLFRTPQRLYDPELGVFASRDPLLYADSPSPYVYAAQNPVDFADPTGFAKTPLAERGYSIAPPPPISGSNDILLFKEGDWWKRYENSRREAKKPEPDLRTVYEGMLISPLAYLEEMARGILNTPHSVVNAGTHGGEHIARGYLWVQQGEWAEAVAEGAEAVMLFSLAFLDLASLGEGSAASKKTGAVRRAVAPPAALPEVVIHYDPIFKASPGDSNWYRFVVEALQTHQGGSLVRALGRNEKRLATDAALRRRARRELTDLGYDLSDLQAGHPADSIINPYIHEGNVGTAYYFMEGRVNGEFGRQFGQQLNMLGVEKGGRFRVTFSGPWPDFAEFPPMAPPASSPGLR